VRVNGKPVKLGPLEYKLVEYLARNGGVAISREQILAEVYGIDADIGTGRVDLLVRRLRLKLGAGGVPLLAGHDRVLRHHALLPFGWRHIVSRMANDTFRALAHPLRREIVERLSGGEASVGEVSLGFGVSKPTISRHLRILEEAGIVSRVIVGRNHRLALQSEALADAEEWIERQRIRWERMFDVVGEYLEERKERP